MRERSVLRKGHCYDASVDRNFLVFDRFATIREGVCRAAAVVAVGRRKQGSERSDGRRPL
jgi:hypothetical protein